MRKKVVAFAAATAMCGSILLNYPAETFNISLSVSAATGDVAINETNFPDAAFRTYVDEKFDTTDDDVLTADEIDAVTEIHARSMSITDLTGIEFFTALTYLACSSNELTSLDVSSCPELIYLECYSNQLSSLDVSNNSELTYLSCYHNQLTSLDVSGCTALTELSCYDNRLTSLDVNDCTALIYLDCSYNQLTSLDVSKNTVLDVLGWSGNIYEIALTDGTFDLSTLPGSFDVSKASAWTNAMVEGSILTVADPTIEVTYTYDLGNGKTADFSLEIVSAATDDVDGVEINKTNFPDATFRTYVDENFDTTDDDVLTVEELAEITVVYLNDLGITDLTGIEHFTTLIALYCSNNQLTSLDLSKNTALGYLECSDNQLTSLDISGCESLAVLNCDSNQLTGLDVSGYTALTELRCNENQLTSLDLSKNEKLEHLSCYDNQLTSLDVNENAPLTYLSCERNQLTSLDVSGCASLIALHCYSNQLTSLDVSGCTALTTLSCYNNIYKIELTNGTFDLGTLPGDFDVSKASAWTNATVEGGILTVADPTIEVTYTYDLGNGKTADFSLEIVSAAQTEGICGDANVDGSVSVADVILVNQAYMKTATLEGQGAVNADVDLNGSVDLTDSLNILKSLIDLVTLPVQ